MGIKEKVFVKINDFLFEEGVVVGKIIYQGNDTYRVLSSPVIIHNIQSEDFRTKMFEQMTLNGVITNGAVTPLGAELINELLSVFPAGYGS